jgi:hypothetical protein
MRRKRTMNREEMIEEDVILEVRKEIQPRGAADPLESFIEKLSKPQFACKPHNTTNQSYHTLQPFSYAGAWERNEKYLPSNSPINIFTIVVIRIFVVIRI